LFDYSIAGPFAGLVITIPILLWGLSQSQVVPIPTQPVAFAALQPDFSILLLLLSKLMLGAKLTANTALNLHPLGVTGCLGLLFTSINLIPVGQLDGGHIVHAMYGQRMGAMIGQVTRVLALLMALLQPWLLFLAIFLLFIPAFDEPTLNDVTELDNRRDFWGLLSLAFLLLMILPAPAFLTNLLLPG
jgi:membrane-associated protease RseP (regulator of RpoE activity)